MAARGERERGDADEHADRRERPRIRPTANAATMTATASATMPIPHAKMSSECAPRIASGRIASARVSDPTDAMAMRNDASIERTDAHEQRRPVRGESDRGSELAVACEPEPQRGGEPDEQGGAD